MATNLLRPTRTTSLSSGMICVLLGLGSFALSHGRDGFDKGLLLGMTIALMVLGAYLLGSATFRKGTDDEPGDAAWLPSSDER
ncbi:hypothetical protein [Knoellia sp. Soil729]|uniref:hypothetical protein n=1 Tax=Knoellia sp. Soil729 TaxID=1736394 RepID=UPI0006F8FFD8|nr:hypothetical protein [Knoellia sp. Soil729]KRE41965.1 hypothetical protein ASG74_05655 [Knoellia sp. Soil729]